MEEIEDFQEKIEYLKKEVDSLRDYTNPTYNKYVKKFTDYTEKRLNDLQKWKENEISYAEDEKEQSVACCNSDNENYLEQIDSRYLLYLKYKFDELKAYFPNEFQYFASQGADIFTRISKVASITDEKASSTSIKFPNKPLLTAEEIENDMQKVVFKDHIRVESNCIIIDGKRYKVGDFIPLKNGTSFAQLLFIHPEISIVVDGERFTVTPSRLERIVYRM